MKRTWPALLLCLLSLALGGQNARAQTPCMPGTEAAVGCAADCSQPAPGVNLPPGPGTDTGPLYAAGGEYRTPRPKAPAADPRRQAPPPCDDRLACTEDRWENVQGTFRCTHTFKPGFCVIGGVCYAHRQVNPANPCQECRDDWGQAYTTRWGFDNGNPCSDGNPCTYNDRCASGNCISTGYTCNDGNPCTTDTCNGDGTCTHRQTSSPGCP